MSLEQTITLVLSPILRLFDPLITTATGFTSSPRTQRVVIRSAVSVATAFTLIGVAVWSYLIFYWIYVPELSLRNPAWFQYGDIHTSIMPQTATPALPRATIDFTKGGRITKPLHDDQVYSALLEFYVPTSQKNVDLGNFMVSVAFKNAANEVIQYSSRPAILRYHSPLLHTLSTFYRALPLLLEFGDESQRIRVTLIESFTGNSAKPITTAEVTISTPYLQIYAARLILNAHLSGLRYFMYYWPITTATTFVASFLFWEIVFAVSAWRIVARVYPRQLEAIEAAFSDVDDGETATQIGEETEAGEETEVPDDEEVPPTPTTTTSAGASAFGAKDGFETETETEASMSLYGDGDDTETETEGFQEVPRR